MDAFELLACMSLSYWVVLINRFGFDFLLRCKIIIGKYNLNVLKKLPTNDILWPSYSMWTMLLGLA